MSIFIYFVVFASFFSASILYFAPGLITYKQIVSILGLLFYTLFLFKIICNRFMIKKKLFNTIIVCIVILLLYLITPLVYKRTNQLWYSYFLVLIGQVIPAVLLGYYIGQSKRIQNQMIRFTPIIAIIFTFISFNAAVFPTSATSGNFAFNTNGLDYNSASYMAACASGFAQYYIIMHRYIDWFSMFKRKAMKYIFCVLVIFNLVSILIAGGRGGLIVFSCISIISFFVVVIKRKKNISNFIGNIFTLILCIMIIYFAIYIAINSNIDTLGFERIINTIQYGDSSGRSEIITQAINTFINNPFGHGLGSIFFEINTYSHNYFIDCLVEIGLIGMIIIVYLYIYIIKRLVSMFKNNMFDYLWIIIFVFGFVQSFFSGYYLVQIPIYFVISFIYSNKNINN